MTAVATPPRRRRPERTRAVHDPGRRPRPARPWLPLAAFAALCAYAVGHWGGLMSDAPAWRLAAVAAVAVTAAALLAASGSLRGGGGGGLRLAVAAGALAAGLLVTGLEARLLLPGNWDELGEGLDQGFAGLRSIQWPYAGDDEWVRQVLLLGAPVLAVPAALAAFWPARRGRGALRWLGLVLLLVLYGVAVTDRDFDGELLRGVVLALLVGLWLWAPRARPREAGAVAATLAAVTVAAVPVAAALDREDPWFDYRAWNWFGAIDGTIFDWSHSYGPIDWPRDGTTLLRVKTERPLYWKVEVLDRFDGIRWRRSAAAAGGVPLTAELPRDLEPAWEESAEFTVRNLRSELAVVAGTPLRVEGIGATNIAVDGTTTPREGRLSEGDRYTVSAYVPNPSRRRLRAAPAAWDDDLHRYLLVDLPPAGRVAPTGGPTGRASPPPAATVVLPFRGEERPFGVAATEQLLRESPYGATFALARRLTAGAPTTYDAVKAVERHLLDNLRYSERPPERAYPLEAFLFQDRAGYCQQFSGAMALMLRMVGIPARVVGGFAPGSYDRDNEDFRVRDLDAHSWVEVYFTGIGWVQFDPTPSGAPAGSRAEPREAATSATGSTDPGRGDASAAQLPAAGGVQAPGEEGGGGLPAWVPPALVLAAAAVLWLLMRRRWRGGADQERHVRELGRALRRLGYPMPPGTTLLELERRLARAAGPRSASYVRALRRARYGTGGALPRPADRRALRRELSRHAGPLGPVVGWAALPPFRRD